MACFTLNLEVRPGANFDDCIAQAAKLAKELNVYVHFHHTYPITLRKGDDGSVLVKPDGSVNY